MANDRALKLQTLPPKNPGHGKTSLPPTSRKKTFSRGKNGDVPSILHRRIQDPGMDEEKAWGMVMENRGLAGELVKRYHLKRGVKPEQWPDVDRIATYSLFNSAMTWDESKGSFATHAIKCGKECRYWVFLLESPIWVSSGYRTKVLKFLKLRKDDPKFTFDEFLKQKGYGKLKSQSLRAAFDALISKRKTVEMGSLPGEGANLERASEAGSDTPRVGRSERAHGNPEDLHRELEVEIELEKVRMRINEILDTVLDEKTAGLVRLHNGMETGEKVPFREIAEEWGVSIAWVQKLDSNAKKVLSTCRYAKELRQHMETLTYYSCGRGSCAVDTRRASHYEEDD